MAEPYHSEFERRIAKYLEASGYPPASLVYEPVLLPSTSRVAYRPDFGVLDPDRGEYLALFEVKGQDDSATLRDAAAQLNQYAAAIGKPDLPRFIVAPGEAATGPRVYAVGSNGGHHKIALGELPSFGALKGSVAAATSTRAADRLRETTGTFRVISSIVAAMATMLAGADFYLKEFRHITLLTPERLSLVGVAIALVVIPFAAKLKAFGLEYERLQTPKHRDLTSNER
jgi:hypothetical protein